MKAITYIRKIDEAGACSIHTAEKLTEALHREQLLHPDLVLRFRPLYGDFDFVHKSWFEGNLDAYNSINFYGAYDIIAFAQDANREYMRTITE